MPTQQTEAPRPIRFRKTPSSTANFTIAAIRSRSNAREDLPEHAAAVVVTGEAEEPEDPNRAAASN